MKSRITEDMKTAMRAKESQKLGVIRMLLAAIKQKEIDERIELDDAQILNVLNTMLKQRKGSIAEFEKASRDDLIAVEKFEIDVLSVYLPEQLSENEVTDLVKQAISESGAQSMKEMGAVMAILKPKLQGKTDMGAVSGQVKQLLS